MEKLHSAKKRKINKISTFATFSTTLSDNFQKKSTFFKNYLVSDQLWTYGTPWDTRHYNLVDVWRAQFSARGDFWGKTGRDPNVQVQPVTCWYLSVFLLLGWDIFHTYSSQMIDNFPEVWGLVSMIESTFTLQYGGQRPTWKLTLTLDPVILFIYFWDGRPKQPTPIA